MEREADREDPLLRSLYLFIGAGSSALLLSIAHTHHNLWFVSLIALIPYLWMLRRSNLLDSLILGWILAFSFSLVVFIDSLVLSQGIFFCRLFSLLLIFSLFGAAANKIMKYIRFYPVFLAAIWIPLEYFLINYGKIEGILDFPHPGPVWQLRFASLFGWLVVISTIILINILVLLLLEYLGRILRTSARVAVSNGEPIFILGDGVTLYRICDYLPDLRGPPGFFSLRK